MKYKVGDLIRDKRWPEDGYAVIISIGDRRTKTPYRVYCIDLDILESFPKDYIEQDCVVINEAQI
jgi:hypothetical protein